MNETPTREVLPCYRDENLADTFMGEVLEILKTVPTEWRQSVMASAHKDTYLTKFRPSSHNLELMESFTVPTGASYYAALKARAAQAIDGTLTPRVERIAAEG